MGAPDQPQAVGKAVILRTGPDPRGFVSRYLLALTPLVLCLVSVILTSLMRGFLGGSFTPAMSGPAGSLLAGMGDLMEMGILLIAPVGVYLIFVILGWEIRSTEMWAGSILALGLSSLAGLLVTILAPDMSLSPALDYLYWIAYLIAPVSLVVVILVLGFTEQFRRSISYNITREGLVLRGGIWKQKEHIFPWNQIGELIMEQNPVGKFLGTGTIIPLGRGGAAAGGGTVWGEISRSPLDCIFGVREPVLLMEFLRELISRSRDTQL